MIGLVGGVVVGVVVGQIGFAIGIGMALGSVVGALVDIKGLFPAEPRMFGGSSGTRRKARPHRGRPRCPH